MRPRWRRRAAPAGQVLAEFAGAKCEVRLHNLRDGSTQTLTLAELLPHAFDGSSLNKP